MSATLIVRRLRRLQHAFIDYVVFLDDKPVATVGNGKTVSLTLPLQPCQLTLSAQGDESVPVHIAAGAADVVTVEVFPPPYKWARPLVIPRWKEAPIIRTVG